jgi:hypothetical protein
MSEYLDQLPVYGSVKNDEGNQGQDGVDDEVEPHHIHLDNGHEHYLGKIDSSHLDIGRILPEVSKYNSWYEGRLSHQVEGVVDNLQLEAVLPVSYQVPAGANIPDGHCGVENVEGIVRRYFHQTKIL